MYIDPTCIWVPYGTDPNIDVFVDSKDFIVRKSVAEQGYGLDKLINDSDPRIRSIVAEQGYGLDILANDVNANVREAVAKYGYGLNKLFYDVSFKVNLATMRYLTDHCIFDLLTWIKQNPDKCVEYEYLFLDKFLYKLEKHFDAFMQNNAREFLIPKISIEFVLLHVTHKEDYIFICSSLHFKNGDCDERSAIIYNQIDLDNYIFNLVDTLNQHEETKDTARILLDCAI